MFRLFLSNLGHGRSIFGRSERPECAAPTRHTFEKNGPKMAFFWANGPKSPYSPQNIFGPKFLKKCFNWLLSFPMRRISWRKPLISILDEHLKIENFWNFFRKIPFWAKFKPKWDFSKKNFKNFRFSSVRPESKWAVCTMKCGELGSLEVN